MVKHLTNQITHHSLVPQALRPPPCQHHSFKKGGEGPGHRLLLLSAHYNYSATSSADFIFPPFPFLPPPAAKTSRLFSMFPSSALDWISHEPLTANFHSYGVTIETFSNNPNLTEFFTILSTNLDREGVEFVSTIENEFLL